MIVTLTRHGKTAGNLENRYIGITDEPLCDVGRQELSAAGQDDTADEVWVTPLLRTRQTADILYPNAIQRVSRGMAEMNFGTYEGKNYLELAEDTAYRAWVEGGCEAPCPDGESKEDFSRRVCRAFEKLAEEALEQGREKLTLVVHGGTIMALCAAYGRPQRDYFSWQTPNGASWRFILQKTTWTKQKTMFLLSAPKEKR